MPEVVESSVVGASPEAVWRRVSSFEGVNDELRPVLRMTAPRHLRALDPAEVPLGERLFRSWVLLFGVLPFDYDDLTLVRIDPGRGFLERSKMLSQRLWEHERTLQPAAGGCRVTDRLRFEPRVPGTGALSAAFVRRVFRHRHRRLRRRFGSATPPPGEGPSAPS